MVLITLQSHGVVDKEDMFRRAFRGERNPLGAKIYTGRGRRRLYSDEKGEDGGGRDGDINISFSQVYE